MSKKSDLLARLVKAVPLRQSYPAEPKAGVTLLEQGVVLVLMRHMTQRQAEASLGALQTAYPDWNEARVSQVQELAAHLKTGSKKKGVELLNERTPAARALKDYLQDVFQETHGLDLEFLRDDLAAGGKLIAELSQIGVTGGSYLLWTAQDGRIPVHLALVRLMDRLGFGPRTTSMKKASEALDPLVPKGEELRYTLALHEVLERWNDPEKPIYDQVEVLREIPYGKKAYTERKAQVKRAEAQRKREEERRATAERKELERKRRDDERLLKRAQAEARRREKEFDRKRKADARKRAADERKAAAKADAERKRTAAIKKKAAAKKAAAKKAAAKKAASMKAAAKKKAAKKKAAKKTTKKAAAMRPSKKKAASKAKSKKPVKRPAKKAAAKKAPARKSKKKAASKASSRKSKRPVSKKPVSKKPVSKKKSAARKATRSSTSRKKSAASSKKRTSARRR